MLARSVFVLVIVTITPLVGSEFVENIGQLPPEYRYTATNANLRLLARNNGDLVIRARAPGAPRSVTLAWLGASPGTWAPGPSTGSSVRHCRAGLSRAACERGVETRKSVRRSRLFDGIDLVLHGDGGRLEYDLELQPGASAESVRFELRGDAAPALLSDGRIVAGDFIHWAPIAYQSVDGVRRPVDCAVRRLTGNIFTFALTGPYRADLPLVIDPVIESAQVVAGPDPAEDHILGQSAGYVFGVSKRLDADNWDVFVSYNGVSTYWGGDGDEQVMGFDVDANNGILTLVGATASKNAYTVGAFGAATAFRGGRTDGFLLEYSRGTLTLAALLGGPGADRLNDVRRSTPSAIAGPYLFAGETDDPNWTGFTALGTPAGGTDAVVGHFGSLNDSLLVAGGPDADSARSIRPILGTAGAWIVAGETESTGFAGKSSPGRDAWIGRLSSAPLRLESTRSWGGSGDDRLAGLAVVPGYGVILAGTTNSTDLPGVTATGAQFNGGSSDGFIALLDPVDFTPLQSRYLGGSGADEILSLSAWSNDLFLAGFTDSPALSLPVLRDSDPAGRQDGLFIHADMFLNPIVAYRAGGAGDDRFTAAEPTAWGLVNLAGWSDSRPWLATLDPVAPSGDMTAAFSIALRYAVVAVTGPETQYIPAPQPILTIGRDLATYLPVAAYNEPASDGVLIVRSADPSKLRIAGEEAALLARADDRSSPAFISLEALAAEGEVDIVISGRTPNPGPSSYPDRHVRIRLAPSRAYIQPQPGGVLDVLPGVDADVAVHLAPLLPNGEFGPTQDARQGLDALPSLISSDPETVLPATGWQRAAPGVYRFRMKGLRPGTATLSLQSGAVPAVQGPPLSVRVAATFPSQSTAPWARPIAVLLDHTLALDFSLAPGDRLQFTAEDPTVTAIGNVAGSLGGSVLLVGAGNIRIWVSALRSGSAAGIRVEGVFQGKPVTERIEILPLPYTLSVSGIDRQILLPGSVGFISIEARPQGALAPGVSMAYQSIRLNSPLARLEARFSDPSVAALDGRTIDGTRLNIRFKGLQLGRATLEFDLNGTPSSITVEVRPPSLSFGPELRVPELSKVAIGPLSRFLDAASSRSVRIRVNDPKLFSLEWAGRQGSDLTVDLNQFYVIALDVKSPAGTNGALFVSAPDLPEMEVPVRVMEKILLPATNTPRVRFAPGEAVVRGSLNYSFAAYDPAFAVAAGGAIVSTQVIAVNPPRFRVTVSPSGICDFPAEVESGQFTLTLSFACRSEGRVKVDLQGPGLSPEQARFSVWLTAVRTPRPSFFEGRKVSVAAGTQTEFALFSQGRRFTGTLVSGDPTRVKLAPSPERPGTDRLTGSDLGTAYVQAFASEGVVWLEAQHDDGSRDQIPVFLYPATMAVRTGDASASAPIRLPADQSKLSAFALPVPFDPGSGLVIAANPPLALTAGMDPFFLKSVTTDPAVAEPAPPNPLFSETDRQRPVNFKINGKGRAVLTVQQPAGFYAARNAGLGIEVVERELKFVVPAAAPGLQTLGYFNTSTITGLLDTSLFDLTVPVTLTSLDPSKLLLSASQSVPGNPVLTLTSGVRSGISVQILNSAQPGDRLRIRVTAPGFTESITEIPVSPAELQWYPDNSRALTAAPGGLGGASLRLGPIDPLSNGQINRSWVGGLLPGANVRLKPQAADPTIFALPRAELDLDANAMAFVTFQGLRPGLTDLLLTAPEGIVNRAERSPVRVTLWELANYSAAPGAKGLWAPITLTNPRNEPTAVTIRGEGTPPVGLAASSASLPSQSPLSITLPPRGEVTFFWTALASGYSASLLVTAPDFNPRTIYLSTSDPELAFQSASPLQLPLAGRTASVALQLRRNVPLPLAAPSLPVEVRSSDPRILRVVSSPVQFKTGQSTVTFEVEILSAGTAVLTATLPADFAPPAQSGTASLPVVIR